jgi:hypothetical protein
MSEDSLLIAYVVLELIAKQPRRTQLEIRKRLLDICAYPYNHSDYLEPDDSGRRYHVNLFGDYAISYWVDEADQHIKIMKIRSSDRAH